MNEKKNITIWHYLLSSEARMTIIVPLVLYYAAFALWGAGIALLVTAVYSGGLEILNKRKGERQGSLSIIALILISGMSHYLYLKGYRFFGIAQEGVFLSVSGALSVVVVFLGYSLTGQPVIRRLAEQAIPRLKSLPFYGSSKYARVWQEVSLAWIVIYFLKAGVVCLLSRDSDMSMSAVILIAGWPLTIAMIAFSVRWPKYRWSSHPSVHPSKHQ